MDVFILIGDEEVICLSHAKVHVFSDSVLCFGRMNAKPQSNCAWEDGRGSKVHWNVKVCHR